MPDARVTVTVHGPDPLSRAGVVRHLQQQPTVELIAGDEPPGTVAVMLADRLDDACGAELRRLVRGGTQRVVLVAGELRETELMAVMEYGVRAVLWQHRTTPRRLVRAVLRAARTDGRVEPCGVDRRLSEPGVRG
ncbi:DNA-binding response regulator [Streptomyces cucumeris]|uniref:DNA-binding response regulator n=1 Tax=Streptomyces cucumeris TaxID=2962890 RepID=UPI003D7580AF